MTGFETETISQSICRCGPTKVFYIMMGLDFHFRPSIVSSFCLWKSVWWQGTTTKVGGYENIFRKPCFDWFEGKWERHAYFLSDLWQLNINHYDWFKTLWAMCVSQKISIGWVSGEVWRVEDWRKYHEILLPCSPKGEWII